MLEVGLAAPVLLVIVLGFFCASFTCTGACLGGELWVNDAVDFLEIIIVLKTNPTLFMGNSGAISAFLFFSTSTFSASLAF